MLVFSAYFLIVFLVYYKESRLKNELVISTGRITNIDELSGLYGGGDAHVYYYFIVKGNKYKGTLRSEPLIYKNRYILNHEHG